MTSNLGEIRGLAGFQIADVASAEICRRVLSAHSSRWRPLVPTRLAQSEFTGEHFPYDAFDRLPTTPIAVGGGTLNVGFAPGEFALPRSALMAWLEKSAKAVSVYFGKFPVASAKVLIVRLQAAEYNGEQLSAIAALQFASRSGATAPRPILPRLEGRARDDSSRRISGWPKALPSTLSRLPGCRPAT